MDGVGSPALRAGHCGHTALRLLLPRALLPMLALHLHLLLLLLRNLHSQYNITPQHVLTICRPPVEQSTDLVAYFWRLLSLHGTQGHNMGSSGRSAMCAGHGSWNYLQLHGRRMVHDRVARILRPGL